MSVDVIIDRLRRAKTSKSRAEMLGHLRVAKATLDVDAKDLEKALAAEDPNQLSLVDAD